MKRKKIYYLGIIYKDTTLKQEKIKIALKNENK